MSSRGQVALERVRARGYTPQPPNDAPPGPFTQDKDGTVRLAGPRGVSFAPYTSRETFYRKPSRILRVGGRGSPR